ncbi:uncharacterized protein LOC126659560 [Mercurialis annua]|uniref:uncharacterized protein LOC126659560 n=1 Tax=Mercurialis annua TaxID=3986 RepID=UPI00215F4938|nr:uncharacterized protein LOC126659560 [Mercurialis annua]
MFVVMDSHHSEYTLSEELTNIDLSLVFESSSDSESPLAKKPKLENSSDQDSDDHQEKNDPYYQHYDVPGFRALYFEDQPLWSRWMKQGTLLAVEKFNNLGKYPKLNLVEIQRATHWTTAYYVTFLAREEGSPIIRTYRSLFFHAARNRVNATTQVFYIRSAPPINHDQEESDDGEEESDDDETVDRSSIMMEGGAASPAA